MTPVLGQRIDSPTEPSGGDAVGLVAWVVTAIGVPAAVVAAVLDPAAARGAAGQDWPPFVLVAGLLLVGLVAADDGVFEAAGAALAASTRQGITLMAGATILVAAVTAVLNLDTSVAFLTPVLVAAARVRAQAGGTLEADIADPPRPRRPPRPPLPPLEAPLVTGCLLLSNAGSLLLPGSNLTNLIVLGHLHLSGARVAARTAPAWGVAVVMTAAVVAIVYRHRLTEESVPRGALAPTRLRGVLGLAAVAAATAAVLLLHQPAPVVAVVGVVAAAAHLVRPDRRCRRSLELRRVLRALGGPILLGLLGIAVGAGALGRAWSGPAQLLGHVGSWGAAAVAAGTSLVGNNLPAASLLAARRPPHPFALLVGLDLGPNLFVTGSLSSLLWWQAARAAGARPSVRRVTMVGIVSAPLAAAGALAMLALTGTR